MDPARPLRDVFADLAGDEDARRAHAEDPEGFLAGQGHAGLDGDLVAEAIVSYADTAPAEVAEHLAPFVRAHGPVPLEAEAGGVLIDSDPSAGLDLLATAPVGVEPADLPAEFDDGGEPTGAVASGTAGPEAGGADADLAEPFDLDFGHGDAAAATVGSDQPGDAGANGGRAGDPEDPGSEAPAEAGTPEPGLGPAGDLDDLGELDAAAELEPDDLDPSDLDDRGDLDPSGPDDEDPGALG